MTGGDAGPARSYRGAPGAQGPCFVAAAVTTGSTTGPATAAPSTNDTAAASTSSATAMREIVHLQAGQCGNQIGAKVRGEPASGGGREGQRGVLELRWPPPLWVFWRTGTPGGQHPRDGGGGGAGAGAGPGWEQRG